MGNGALGIGHWALGIEKNLMTDILHHSQQEPLALILVTRLNLVTRVWRAAASWLLRLVQDISKFSLVVKKLAFVLFRQSVSNEDTHP